MNGRRVAWLLAVLAANPAWVHAAGSPEAAIGRSVDELIAFARERNPEYASMRFEAQAADERIVPAGALPDPRLRTEWMDITKMGEQSPTLAPARVGYMRYTVLQDVPWFGKRDLKREIAGLEAEGARGQAAGNWAELSTRIKSAYAQLYAVQRTENLTREILDLMARLERVAQVRYSSGLVPQQDVIRSQVEQTNLKNELVAVDNERRQVQARLNALLTRPPLAPLAEPERLRPLPQPAKLDFAVLEERIRARNPSLFVEETRIHAAEKKRELTYKNRYPDFTFGVAPNQFGSSIKEWDLMVEINIPLQQASRRSQEREAEAMLLAAQTRKEAASNQVLSALAEDLAGIDAARQTEALVTTSLLPQADLTFQAALAGYETGKVDFATLLDAQRQIRQARQNQIRAQAEAQMRLSEIEGLLGEDL